ncbi:MAG TPA: ATP synthase F0 subunit C [Phycisphaerae bacterium]|nr:ATP synthase F0 subunit C [Phycisphaerae bacterium]HPM25445.1 ATP synthase F0 subunit C [Phycisphaerae bacterium]HQL55970.1 ATP synthase F0 subunit C [Phycisphaerae bacterium]
MLTILAEAVPLFSNAGLMGLGAGIGAGLVCIGAAKGIGHLAGCAVESMARQPEVRGNAFIAMIIAAALIEGFTFFALVVCNGIAGKIATGA